MDARSAPVPPAGPSDAADELSRVSSAVVVRDAAPGDLDAVLDCLDHLREDGTEQRAARDDSASVWERILDTPGRRFLVAEIAGEVVGCLDLIVVENLTHHATPWAILENVVVKADRRNGGIGAALVSEAVRRAREAGCYKVQLLSNAVRTDAHRFYDRLGFERSAQGFRLYLEPLR